MKKIFALSDIHGRATHLDDYLKKGFDLENPDHLMVFIGDYFDRHGKNLEVLEFCESMVATIGDRCVLIKGNHDEFVMNFLKELDAYSIGDVLKESLFDVDRWLRNGGRITLDNLFGSLDGVYTEEKYRNKIRLEAFTKQLIDYFETDDYIFVHAAIDEDRQVDVWNRDFFHQGADINKKVVIGHTTFEYLEDYQLVKTIHDQGIESVYAQSLKETRCPVFDIDNGQGNNIVIFEEAK